MKKNLMSLAVAASVAGVAASTQAAMYLNPEGTGQVLLYPFYNAENGNETSIHIVNTTGDGKAVKVRILEYINSQEVLDFNLYLSPYDHFAFTIFENPNGTGGALVTRDNSCTVPTLGTEVGDAKYDGYTTEDGAKIQPFLPYLLENQKDPLKDIVRSKAGHVEVIEMGTLTNPTATFRPLAWATHDADGVPASCAKLVAAWDPSTGTWTGDATKGVTAVSGGLYGVSNHLNNTDAAAFGIEAGAIADFWATGASNHTDPGNLSPSLGQGVQESIVTVGGESFTLAWNSGWDSVSSLFQKDWIYNDVMINPVIGGMTDWVVTFPTKRHYVNTAPVKKPFSELYLLKGASKYTYAGLACDPVEIKQWNREESTPVGGKPVFSPKPDDIVVENEICLETNTIAMGPEGTASALNVSMGSVGAEYAPGRTLDFISGESEGWMRMGFQDGQQVMTPTSIGGVTNVNPTKGLYGLPAMGFAAFKYVNGAMSFGFTSDHKGMVTGSAVKQPRS